MRVGAMTAVVCASVAALAIVALTSLSPLRAQQTLDEQASRPQIRSHAEMLDMALQNLREDRSRSGPLEFDEAFLRNRETGRYHLNMLGRIPVGELNATFVYQPPRGVEIDIRSLFMQMEGWHAAFYVIDDFDLDDPQLPERIKFISTNYDFELQLRENYYFSPPVRMGEKDAILVALGRLVVSDLAGALISIHGTEPGHGAGVLSDNIRIE